MSVEANGHDRWRDCVALHALDILDDQGHRDVEAHLRTCAACAADLLALRTVVDALAMSAPPHDPPAGMRARVLSHTHG